MANGWIPRWMDRMGESFVPEPNSGCWLWTRRLSRDGYGVVFLWRDGKSRPAYAHRAAYIAMKGPIPDGLTIDHLCHTPSCVNPDHLEACTMLENIMRGRTFSVINARATHCIHGHPFDEANTIRRPKGRRGCRACNRAAVARYIARKRASRLDAAETTTPND